MMDLLRLNHEYINLLYVANKTVTNFYAGFKTVLVFLCKPAEFYSLRRENNSLCSYTQLMLLRNRNVYNHR